MDPGNTVGLAIFDLSGREILISSAKNVNMNWVIDRIIDSGTPVIIATDVTPAPSYVKKLASVFSAKLFVPRKDMSVRLKDELTKTFTFNNDHEMDAAAAIIYALKHYSQMFKKVDERVPAELQDFVKAGLVLGEFASIDDAMRALHRALHETKVEHHKVEKKTNVDVSKLFEKIAEFKRAYTRLLVENDDLKKTLRALRNRPKIMVHEENCSRLKVEIAHLKEIVEKFKSASLEKFYEVVEIENYGKSVVLSSDVSGKVVRVLKNTGNPKYLEDAKLIIANFSIDVGVPVVSEENVNLIKVDNKIYIRKDEVEDILRYHNGFLNWIKKYKKRYHGEK